MQRRQFLIGTATAIGGQILAGSIFGQAKAEAETTDRTYHILGVPLRAGSLLPGNENDAQAYRDVQLLARLQAHGTGLASGRGLSPRRHGSPGGSLPRRPASPCGWRHRGSSGAKDE